MFQQNLPDVLSKLIDKGQAAVEVIATQLSKTAPEVWKAAVLQTRIDGIEYLIGSLVSIIIGIILYKYIPIWYNQAYSKVDVVIPSILGSITLIITFSLCVVNGINYSFNPAYWTVLNLISRIQGK